jgi:hypothetical protein
MIESLPPDLLENLEKLGQAIDMEKTIHVFDGGRVGFNLNEENEDIKDVAKRTCRPWQGKRKSRRRAASTAHDFRTGTIKETFGTQFRVLAQDYEALASEDENGLWVSIVSYPLGERGPKVHLLVGMPLDLRVAPRAWAFGSIGPNASALSLRHTNFPDASICAFTVDDKVWKPEDGLLPLVDCFSTWVLKKWHFEKFGWWPGPQIGACALYRRLESDGREWCGCQSGRRYASCHQGADLLKAELPARAEFRQLFLCDYEGRSIPSCIFNAAQSRWKKLPKMSEAFFHWMKPGEPVLPF